MTVIQGQQGTVTVTLVPQQTYNFRIHARTFHYTSDTCYKLYHQPNLNCKIQKYTKFWPHQYIAVNK
jgi:hypothetical protein